MKRTTVMSAVLLMLALSPVAFAAAAPKAAAPDAAKPAAQTSSADLKTTAAKYGYVIGMDIGRKIGDLKDKVDVDALIRGMRDAFDGRQTAFTDEQAMEIQKSFVMDMQKQSMAKMEKESVENETESKAFFAKNRTEKGVQVTTSGLQYSVLQDGKGASPKPGDIVRVHYRGTFINGEEFDSSIKRNEPAEFPVTEVIPGWTEALLKMKTGAKWKVFVPAGLAYGPEGRPPRIPPNKALVFEVELLDIVNPVDQPAMPGMPGAMPGQPGARPTPPPQPKVRVKQDLKQ